MGRMTKVTQAAKQYLGLTIMERRSQMSFEVYAMIANKSFFSLENGKFFHHLCFALDWCLEMMHWFFNCKIHSQQAGDECGHWHNDANPRAPWICPLLSFARY